ncbi:MAG: CHAT domain-containing protein [Elainellaceae cyanobacterium]
MTQEFHISVTPVRGDEYLVRVEQVEPGVPLAEEQLIWTVDEWLDYARQLMNNPLLGVLQGDRVNRVADPDLPLHNSSMADVSESSLSFIKLGRSLYSALFQGTLRDSWMTAQGIAQHRGEVLRLRLGLKGARLPKIPWEVLQDDGRSSSGLLSRPIATGRDIVFSRYQPGSRRVWAGTSPALDPHQPVRVLMAIAAPTDQQQLDLKREALHLQQELRHQGQAFSQSMIGILPDIQLTILEQPGREELAHAIEQGRYHVFHYAGHSNLSAGGGILYLVNRETGLTETLNGDDLAGLLANNGVRMVVFNSCRGSYSATADPSARIDDRSLTEALVGRGIPAVLAMAEQIPDGVALTLTRLFYRNLKQGYPVDLSLSRARQGLLSSYGGHQLYWALPVLYLHSEFDGYLTSGDRSLDNPADSLVRMPQLYPSSGAIESYESTAFQNNYPPSSFDTPDMADEGYLEADNIDELVNRLTYGDEAADESNEPNEPNDDMWMDESTVPGDRSSNGRGSFSAYNDFDPLSNGLRYDDAESSMSDLVRELSDPLYEPPNSEAFGPLAVDDDLNFEASAEDESESNFFHPNAPRGVSSRSPVSSQHPPSRQAYDRLSNNFSDDPELFDAPELDAQEPTNGAHPPARPLLVHPDPPRSHPEARTVRHSIDRRLIWLPLVGLGIVVLIGGGYWVFNNRQALFPAPQSSDSASPPEAPSRELPEDLRPQESNLLAQQAITQFNQGDLDAGAQAVETLLDQNALIQARSALNVVPLDDIDNPEISFLRGRLVWQLIQQGDFDFSVNDARRYWEVATRGEPNSARYANALGFAFYQDGQFAEAIDSWQRSLAILESQGIEVLSWPELGQQFQASGATEPIQLPPETDALTAYAGMALALAKSADSPDVEQSPDEMLQQAIWLHRSVLASDPVNFEPQSLSTNWLWTPASLEDWQQLSSLTLGTSAEED